MTKVEAIRALMEDYDGVVTLRMIYDEIEKYYPNAKKASDWKAGLRGVLYRDIGKSFKKLSNSTYAPIDYNDMKIFSEISDDSVTEKEAITKIRIQQSMYRRNLLKKLKRCPITLVTDKRILVASHIKPWHLSNNNEKIDIFNGFIFTPLYDSLFDSGLITFSTDKKLYISSSLSKDTISKLNLKEDICEELPVKGREKYLSFHNEKVFIE